MASVFRGQAHRYRHEGAGLLLDHERGHGLRYARTVVYVSSGLDCWRRQTNLKDEAVRRVVAGCCPITKGCSTIRPHPTHCRGSTLLRQMAAQQSIAVTSPQSRHASVRPVGPAARHASWIGYGCLQNLHRPRTSGRNSSQGLQWNRSGPRPAGPDHGNSQRRGPKRLNKAVTSALAANTTAAMIGAATIGANIVGFIVIPSTPDSSTTITNACTR